MSGSSDYITYMVCNTSVNTMTDIVKAAATSHCRICHYSLYRVSTTFVNRGNLLELEITYGNTGTGILLMLLEN